MKRKHVLIAIVLSVVICGMTITLLVNPELRHAIVEPLADALFVIRYVIAGLPEYLVWVVLVLLASALVIRSWKRTRKRKAADEAPRPRRQRVSKPRVSPSIDLATAVARAPKSRLMRGRVRRDLVELAVRLVARSEAVPLPEARRRIRDEEPWTDDALVLAILGDRGRYAGAKRRDVARDIEYTVRFLESYYEEV